MNWIKISERLPEDGENIFILTKNKDVRVGYRSECLVLGDTYYFLPDGFTEAENVLFWAPIELPKELQ